MAVVVRHPVHSLYPVRSAEGSLWGSDDYRSRGSPASPRSREADPEVGASEAEAEAEESIGIGC